MKQLSIVKITEKLIQP